MTVRATLFVAIALAFAAAPAHAQDPSGPEAAAALESSLVQTIAGAEKSVVAIARVRKEQAGDTVRLEVRPDPFSTPVTPLDPNFIPNEYGAGVVVDGKGLILTAAHVLGDENDSYYITTSDRRVYRAAIKASDPRSDMAVLSVFGADADSINLTPIRLGDSASLRKGRIVVTLGNPYAIARDGQASAGWGIVSNLDRKAPPPADDADRDGEPLLHRHGGLIETDARLHLGASGGPLLNLKGEMVGLCISTAAISGYESSAGYAIPVDSMFRRVLEVLKQGREAEYGFMGIRPSTPMTDAEKAAAGLPADAHGIHLRVERGCPADRAGLRDDDIITSVDGRPIYDADMLVLDVGRLPVEATARIGILRGGAPRTIDVVLSKFPVRGRKIITVRPAAWRGMRVDYASSFLEPEMALRINVSDDAVVVSDVDPNTPAAQVGVKRGMFISEVDGRPVRTPRQFRDAIADKSGAVQLKLVVGDPANSVLVVPPGS